MLRLTLLPGLMGALLAALLIAGPAHGSIVQALDLEELVAHSDRIVLGRVLFSESFQLSDGRLGTWYRIRVERDIGGAAPDETEVIVETLGGRVGNIAMHVEGEPSLAVGERVIVFIRDGGPYTAFRPVGMGQGVMRVREEEGVETVTQSRQGMMLMRRSPDGHWRKSLGALPTAERLETFIKRVSAIVEQQAEGPSE